MFLRFVDHHMRTFLMVDNHRSKDAMFALPEYEGIYLNTLMFVVNLCVCMYLYNEGLKYVSVCISGTAGALADKSRGQCGAPINSDRSQSRYVAPIFMKFTDQIMIPPDHACAANRGQNPTWWEFLQLPPLVIWYVHLTFNLCIRISSNETFGSPVRYPV